MRKKLQIFVSSTFSDLQSERQACVEAILKAGHIPAGMELFSAGSETQLEIIKHWIEDSDVYMLLLGGRYGSIEPNSSLSYTEVEYLYAQELNKPNFALIMSDKYLNEKVKSDGKDILEQENPSKLREFKKIVLSKISRFFDDKTEIKLGVFESLLDIQSRYSLTGWVKANEIPDTTNLINQLTELTDKNKALEQELRVIETGRINKIGDYTYEELETALKNIIITIPAKLMTSNEDKNLTLLQTFVAYKEVLSVGITDKVGISEHYRFIINSVVARLRIYELAEIVKVPNVAWSKYQTSKLGNKFLAIHSMRSTKKNIKNSK